VLWDKTNQSEIQSFLGEDVKIVRDSAAFTAGDYSLYFEYRGTKLKLRVMEVLVKDPVGRIGAYSLDDFKALFEAGGST
jgi:hypothetical protein